MIYFVSVQDFPSWEFCPVLNCCVVLRHLARIEVLGIFCDRSEIERTRIGCKMGVSSGKSKRVSLFRSHSKESWINIYRRTMCAHHPWSSLYRSTSRAKLAVDREGVDEIADAF